jgi:hypothetical protein
VFLSCLLMHAHEPASWKQKQTHEGKSCFLIYSSGFEFCLRKTRVPLNICIDSLVCVYMQRMIYGIFLEIECHSTENLLIYGLRIQTNLLFRPQPKRLLKIVNVWELFIILQLYFMLKIFTYRELKL